MTATDTARAGTSAPTTSSCAPTPTAAATMERPRPLAPRVEHKETALAARRRHRPRHRARRRSHGGDRDQPQAYAVRLHAQEPARAQATDQVARSGTACPARRRQSPRRPRRRAPHRIPPPRTRSATPASPRPRPAPAPAIGVLQRVILVEEPVEGSKEARQTPGRVMWRLDSVSTGSGEPLDAAVRAEVDIAERRPEADSAPPPQPRRRAAGLAHHRDEVHRPAPRRRRAPCATSAFPRCATRRPCAARRSRHRGASHREHVPDRPLQPARRRQREHRNADAGATGSTMPLRFANGRRALLLFEKGAAGDRAVGDAFRRGSRAA